MGSESRASGPASGRAAPELKPSAGRIPPNDLDAEAAVLSAVLLSRESLDKVMPLLSPDHFYSEANRRIFEAFLDLHVSGRPIDILTTRSWLADRELLQRVGGASYLAQIADAVPAISNVDDYARIVREKWRLRQLISACQQVAAEGYGVVENAQSFIDQAEQDVYQIARTPESTTVQSIKDVIQTTFIRLNESLQRGNRITGVPTGFTKLDGLTGGLHEGDLVIVAARPGMGKTSFVLNLAVNVALPKLVESEADPDEGAGANVRQEPGHGVVVRAAA